MDVTPCYEIRVRGKLGSRLTAAFEGLEALPGPGGDTLLRGPLVDQAALFGALLKIRDLGLELVEVRLTEQGGK